MLTEVLTMVMVKLVRCWSCLARAKNGIMWPCAIKGSNITWSLGGSMVGLDLYFSPPS